MGPRDEALHAIERIYRERGAVFQRLALAHTGDRERARDAVQEGFARAIRGRSSLRHAASIEAWIARCVVNAAHDSSRRRSRTGPGEGNEDAGGNWDLETLFVREAVLGLPRRQRDALFLRYYLDFDYASIAEALDVEVGTVSATLHAARASLRRALEEVER